MSFQLWGYFQKETWEGTAKSGAPTLPGGAGGWQSLLISSPPPSGMFLPFTEGHQGTARGGGTDGRPSRTSSGCGTRFLMRRCLHPQRCLQISSSNSLLLGRFLLASESNPPGSVLNLPMGSDTC